MFIGETSKALPRGGRRIGDKVVGGGRRGRLEKKLEANDIGTSIINHNAEERHMRCCLEYNKGGFQVGNLFIFEQLNTILDISLFLLSLPSSFYPSPLAATPISFPFLSYFLLKLFNFIYVATNFVCLVNSAGVTFTSSIVYDF